jgi:hypothetical protein
MNTAKKKVLEMVEQKKITTAQADELLAAMRRENRFSARLLVDPFERLTTGTMLTVGALTAGLSVLLVSGLGLSTLKFGGLRFDGFMDIHIADKNAGIAQATVEQLAAWPLAALVLWLVALAFEKRARFIDFLAVTGVARAILLVGGILIALVAPSAAATAKIAQDSLSSAGPNLSELAQIIPMAGIAIAFAGWFIAASVFGFRHASCLRGGKLAGAFIAALLAAEAVSKLAIWAHVRIMLP